MAELLFPKDPLEAMAATGSAVRLAPRPGLGLATVVARKGMAAALKAQVLALHGFEPADGPRRAARGDIAFVGTGPGVWLATQEHGRDTLAAVLARDLEGLASVSDQSGGYAAVRVSGPRARDALAKRVMIDLHPRAFGQGDAAVTNFGLVNAVLVQVDDGPAYDLVVFRSFAEDVWRALLHDCAEFNAVS
jgi:sarcosine oxidase subunit gamma